MTFRPFLPQMAAQATLQLQRPDSEPQSCQRYQVPQFWRKRKVTLSLSLTFGHPLLQMSGSCQLFHEHAPAERVFGFAELDACDHFIEPEALRSAFGLRAESIRCHFVRFKERLVVDLIYRGDHDCRAAFSGLLEA